METENKSGSRIPIADAIKIGETHGYSQVIIVAWDGNTGSTSVVTWGKSVTESEMAAKGGNFVKKALGWPDDLCHAESARVKRKKRLLPLPKGGEKCES
ncbi:hypothetical protein [Runella sp.]|uniref:hypothetical protein n=1 Tax=Runella sp. TaxID=1960881 RepID=UPI003D0EE31B